jgi:autotransporter-associated beta strand protein
MKLIKLGIILAALICAATLQTHARTLTWTGASLSNPTLWSVSGNWSPSFVPADGDALIFPGSAFTTTSFNDLTNLHVFSITFNGSSGSTLNGNSIFLDSAITCNHSAGRARVNFDLTFTSGGGTFYTISDGYLDIEQNVFLSNNQILYLYPLNASASGTNIEIHGIITGNGGLTKIGNGDAHLLGVWPNEYTGPTSVQAGKLHLSKSGVTAISSSLTIGFNPVAFPSVIDHASGQYPPVIEVAISNGLWNFNFTASVTNLTLLHGFVTGSGLMSLLSDLKVLEETGAGVSEMDCSVYLGNETRTIDVGTLVDFTLNGTVIGPGLPTNSPGIIKKGFGNLFLGNPNSYFGPTLIQRGEVWVTYDGGLGSSSGADAGTTVTGGRLVLDGLGTSEPLVMAGGTLGFYGTCALNGSLVLSNITYLEGSSSSAFLQLNGVVSGPESFELHGGTVRLAGTQPNTFGNPFSTAWVFPYNMNAALELAKPDGVVAVPVPVSLIAAGSSTAELRNLQNGGVSDVTLSHNGSWLLNGYTVAPVSLKFSGDGIVNTGGGQLQLNYTGTNQLHALPGSYTAQILGTINCVGSMDDITVESPAVLDVPAQIIGGGALRKLGDGTLKFSGSPANTYSGGTLVNEGVLELRKPNSVLAVPGNLIIGPVASNSLAVTRLFQSSALPQTAAVTVNGNSLFDLNGYGQILTRLNLNDGGDTQTGAGILTFAAGGIVAVDTLDYVSGLRAGAALSGNVETPYLDYLTFSIAPYNSAFVSTEAELDVPANISGYGNILKNGAGQMRFSGNNTFNNSPPTSAGNVQVLEGALIAASATALGGTGGTTFVSTSGTLALDGGITITGEPLSLWSTNSPALASLTGVNNWNGDIQLYRDSVIGVNNGGSLLLNGVLFGTGSVTKINPGTLTFTGAANTYSGDTFVNEGPLVLNKYGTVINYTIAIPHHVTVGAVQGVTTASLTENFPSAIFGSVTVNSGSTWLLNTNEGFQDFALEGHAPLTLNGNAHVQMGASGALYLSPGGGVTVNPSINTTATISGSIGIFSDDTGLAVHPTLVNAGTGQSGNPECDISGSISGIFGSILLRKEGGGALRLTGTNTYAGTNLVNGGTLWVDGLQPQSAVHLNTGTRLKGSGIVGDINLVGSSAMISPGASPGILTCSNFNALAGGSGTLQIELNGTAPGTGYDQLNVRGTVNLNDVSLSRSSGFSSAVSDQFTLINNDASDLVTGTFTGLPQGKKLYIGKELFQISYTGGSGNDVVLTRLVTPPPPVLRIEWAGTKAVRLFWPTNDPLFSLQTITNLPSANWIAALPLPVVIGTNNVVTNSTSLVSQFYRLSNP